MKFEIQLFSLCGYVFAPGKSSVQMYLQVIYFVSLGQLVVVKLNGGTRIPFEGKGNLD
jgi:hypothetical protein